MPYTDPLILRLVERTRSLAADETPRLRTMLGRFGPQMRILDVGCGRGRRLALLTEMGFSRSTGVDVSEESVAAARDAGYDALTPDEWAARGDEYDVALFSHVVEHFAPAPLIEFMDGYLDQVVRGGHVLVVTPTASEHFWLDFDHIKPYYPHGFKDFFSGGGTQTSHVSRHRLKLVEVDFRRSPYTFKLTRGQLLKRDVRWPHVCNYASALAFWATGGLVGRRTGWLGLFKKKS